LKRPEGEGKNCCKDKPKNGCKGTGKIREKAGNIGYPQKRGRHGQAKGGGGPGKDAVRSQKKIRGSRKDAKVI